MIRALFVIAASFIPFQVASAFFTTQKNPPSAPVPLAPIPPKESVAKNTDAEIGNDNTDTPFYRAAIEEAVHFILAAKKEMANTKLTTCTIKLQDENYKDGAFSPFFQLICVLIATYFQKTGYDVSASTEGNTATIHVQLTELQS